MPMTVFDLFDLRDVPAGDPVVISLLTEAPGRLLTGSVLADALVLDGRFIWLHAPAQQILAPVEGTERVQVLTQGYLGFQEALRVDVSRFLGAGRTGEPYLSRYLAWADAHPGQG